MPRLPMRVQHRQPRLSRGIEATWRDRRQDSRLRLVAVLAIDVEEHRGRRLRATLRDVGRVRPSREPGTAEEFGEFRANRRRAPGSDARHRTQAAVVARHLECFQRLDAERVVDPFREFRAHARNGLEQCRRLEAAAQPVELRPAPGLEDLGDRRGDAAPDAGQLVQSLATAIGQDVAHAHLQALDRVRRTPVGADPERVRLLGVQQLGHLPQPLRDALVLGKRQRRLRLHDDAPCPGLEWNRYLETSGAALTPVKVSACGRCQHEPSPRCRGISQRTCSVQPARRLSPTRS